ncbi:unnamed protein product [Caretta caretta]
MRLPGVQFSTGTPSRNRTLVAPGSAADPAVKSPVGGAGRLPTWLQPSPPREVTRYLASLALLVLALACREGTEEQHDSGEAVWLGVHSPHRHLVRGLLVEVLLPEPRAGARQSRRAKQLRWLNCDRFSPGPEAAEGPGSPEGARHPVLVAVLGSQENPGAAFLPRCVERDIGPAGMCCTRGCTRKEMMPFC